MVRLLWKIWGETLWVILEAASCIVCLPYGVIDILLGGSKNYKIKVENCSRREKENKGES